MTFAHLNWAFSPSEKCMSTALHPRPYHLTPQCLPSVAISSAKPTNYSPEHSTHRQKETHTHTNKQTPQEAEVLFLRGSNNTFTLQKEKI